MTPLGQILARDIAASGPMPVARWMALCLGHTVHGYYVTRDPLGVAGDFTTAPEISQIFGELIGLWFADLWLRAGSPPGVRLVELGPGRGTLMADLLRAVRTVPGFAPSVHFVETSPVLRGAQAVRVPGATWHTDLADVPDDTPLLLVANEFFDALPVRQFVRTAGGWRERMVATSDDGFAPVLGLASADALVAPASWNAATGVVVETSPAAVAIATEIGDRLRQRGGAALIVDYGYSGPATGDTLQAVRGHARVDPFAAPGEADLTAHVDFSALAAASGVDVHGPAAQGTWLGALGIGPRTAALARARPDRAEALFAGATRLTDAGQMGRLFKVLALTAPGWPRPEGFAT